MKFIAFLPIFAAVFAASLAATLSAAIFPFDGTALQPGAITVLGELDAATVTWPDKAGRPCVAVFSLDTAKPLITSISVNGKQVIDRAQPIYRASTGKRRGGFDQFFDFPGSHPEGTRSFIAEFHPTGGRARFDGTRLDVSFDGFKLGIFEGTLHYIFFPGSNLIQQRAIVSTNQTDTAYLYDAGLRMTVDEDRRPGSTMDTDVHYFDTAGKLTQLKSPHASEWNPLAVRYRSIAVKTGGGSVAVFPPPHRYFMARDYTTNMGYLWHNSWRGTVSLGIRQLPDDNSPYYPWINAPPGTGQELDLFLLVDDKPAPQVLQAVLPYTHNDRYPALPGYKTFAPHWHYAYTVQAMDKGLNWVPPFKPVLKDMGINIAMIMDFHGDGHKSDVTEVRMKELRPTSTHAARSPIQALHSSPVKSSTRTWAATGASYFPSRSIGLRSAVRTILSNRLTRSTAASIMSAAIKTPSLSFAPNMDTCIRHTRGPRARQAIRTRSRTANNSNRASTWARAGRP